MIPDTPPAGLPGLEALLRLSRSPQAEPDWRSQLATELGVGASAAAIAAAAVPHPPAGSAWFAQPVHLEAGLTRVHLHPHGILRLAREELAELAAAFTRELGAPAWTLHACGDGLLLVGEGAAPAQPVASDPSAWRGQEVAAGAQQLPQDLRRLAAETEMWLHAWSGNTGRGRRGQLPVSGLWFWGGAQLPAPAARDGTQTWRAVGDDPLLHGLAALQVCAAPAAVAPATMRANEAVVAVIRPEQEDAAGWQRQDEKWHAWLHEALRAGEVAQVVLRVDGQRHVLRPSRWRQLLRSVMGPRTSATRPA